MNGPLQKSQIDRYHAQGFLACDDLLEPGASVMIAEIVDEISGWSDSDRRCQHYRELTDSGPVLARTERFLDAHDGIRKLLNDGILAAAVSQLFGEPAVVFKEKINYKHPGGGGFAPHQDAAAYAFGSSHVTCLVAVDENTVENGCLWFSAGRHSNGLLDTNDDGCLNTSLAKSIPWEPVALPPGGVTFFSSFAPHKSESNRSLRSRRSLYVTYNRASEGDLRAEYYAERDRNMSQHVSGGGAPPRVSTIGHFQGRGVD